MVSSRGFPRGISGVKRQQADTFEEFSAQDSGREVGMVTVELALTIGAVVIVVALLIGGLTATGKQSQVCMASREAARAFSIGEDPQTAAATVSDEVQIEVSNDGKTVSVQGNTPGFSFGGLELGNISCEVTTLNEQNVSEP